MCSLDITSKLTEGIIPQAHKRRMVKFVRLAKGQEDIVDVLRMFKSELESAPKPKPKPAAAKTDDLSKRALRRVSRDYTPDVCVPKLTNFP
jgi:hypothetical protein